MNKLIFAAALGLATFALPAFADNMPAMTGKSTKGDILTDSKGMSLYTFDKDADGKSACVEACAGKWPPLMAAAGAKASGDWSTITRAEGAQWAFKGHPLYTWANDKAAGDITGDGVGGSWHLAKP